MLADDAQQAATARRWLEARTERDPAYVSVVVVCELVWVLSRKHQYSREEIAAVLGSLLNIAILQIEEATLVFQALEQFRTSKADFADCCISALGAAAGCQHTVTFDRAASTLPGMRLLS